MDSCTLLHLLAGCRHVLLYVANINLIYRHLFLTEGRYLWDVVKDLPCSFISSATLLAFDRFLDLLTVVFFIIRCLLDSS